jgi:hypothetical protein
MNWFELKTFFLQKVQDVFELIHFEHATVKPGVVAG